MLGRMSYAEQVRTLRRAGKHEEACSFTISLTAGSPEDAELQCEAACVHDPLGREAQAVPSVPRGNSVLRSRHREIVPDCALPLR